MASLSGTTRSFQTIGKVFLVSLSVALIAGLVPNHSAASGAATTARDAAGDPEDVRGKLDIVSTSFRGNGDGTATLTIRTAEKWRSRFIKREPDGDSRQVFLIWEFSSDRTRNFERTGRFFFDENEGRLVFEKNRSSSDRLFRVRRPNLRTAKISLPVRAFRLGSDRLKLRARSTLNGTFGDDVLVEETDLGPLLQPR